MVNAIRARDELVRRLGEVAKAFSSLYPEVKPPAVYSGVPTNEPPFYIAVDDVIETAGTSGKSTGGHATFEFSLRVMCFARHVNHTTAANTVLSYVDAVFNSVLADQRLKGAVDNSFVSVDASGTAPDSSKYFLAAVSIEVRCSVFAVCPCEFREVVA